jgi:tetratricopeptide (TPR) repeat protein
VTCEHCGYAAKFHSYQPRRLVTAQGAVRVHRAYYYCGRCRQSFLPYDDALGLVDEISPGLRPLVCLAGTLAPFADAAEDVLRRFSGVRLSASTVLRATEGEGERLRAQLKGGRMVEPTQAEPKWTKPRENRQPAAYVGLDAFSVPMPGLRAGKAEHRMLYTALLYTPDKEHTRYLVDFELDALAEQVRSQARALGIELVSQLIAVTDGGNGLEEALQRYLAADLTTILDWYHAAEHLCDFATVWLGTDEPARVAWQDAIRRLEEACKVRAEDFPSAWLLLALAHHRAGSPADAKRWFDRAAKWLDDPDSDYDLGWPDRLRLRLLRQEYEQLSVAK